MKNKLNKLGDCRMEWLVEELFGSVSEFARLVEENGDEFTINDIVVKYNGKKDIHTFYHDIS